jgi:O-antigen/teichoic acid export membrane protein
MMTPSILKGLLVTERTFRSINRSFGWFASSYGVALVGYIVVNYCVAHLVGRHDFGFFLVMVTAAGIVGQLGLVGADRSGLREAARLEDHAGHELGQLRAGVRAVCTTTLPAAALGTGAVVALVAHRHGAASWIVLGCCTGIMVYLNGLQKLTACFVRGLGGIRLAGLLEGRSGGALVAVGQAVAVGLLWWRLPGAGLSGSMIAVTVGFAIPIFWACYRLHRTWAAATPTRGQSPWHGLRTVVRRDWKFASNQVGGYVHSTLDLWLCAVLLSAEATSAFGAGLRAAQFLLIPTTSIQVVFAPAISRMSRDHQIRRLERLVRTGSSFATVMAVLLWVPMVFAPGPVLGTMFGSGFAGDGPILTLLATGFLLNSATGLSATTLAMSRKEGWVSVALWGGLVLRIMFGTVAALMCGPVGLAASSMTVTILLYFGLWGLARYQTGVATHLTLRPSLRLLSRVAG